MRRFTLTTLAVVTRSTLTTLAVMTMLMLTAGIAMAALTFHSGPTATFNGATATVTFNASGLGNTAFASLTVNGFATYTCNNHGGKVVPGQNPVAAQPGATGNVPLSESEKNGRNDITRSATVTAPTTPTTQEAGCPNGKNWTVENPTLTATSATLRINDQGTQVFCMTYYSDGTSNTIGCL